MDSAAGLVRPGGILVFVTCSLLPEEGEAQTASFLERNSGFEQVDLLEKAIEYGVAAEWVVDGGALRLRPDYWEDLGGMDGFYIAGFRKSADG
jgi:16S rRNA (cytosine967-C5)-methyltransferase